MLYSIINYFFKSRKTPTTIFPVSKAFETFSTIVIIVRVVSGAF